MITRKLPLFLSAAGLLALLVLTGCGASGPTAKAPDTNQQSSAIAYPQQMSELVSDIEVAVKDNDYETAGAIFADVQGLWKKAADDISARDKNAHDAIATHLENASNELAEDPPKAENVLNALDLLKTDLDNAARNT